MNRWLTPNTESGIVYRSLCIPDTMVPHVRGALVELCEYFNWELQGTLTPDDCVSRAEAMMECFDMPNPLIGEIKAFALDTLPADFILADGSIQNRVDYPDLYSALAPCFIVDADTFMVPDCRGRAVMGSGNMWNVGDVVGEIDHTLTIDELTPHSHTDLGHVHGYAPALPNLTTIGVELPEPTAIPGIAVTDVGNANLTDTGGGNPFSIMQPTITLLVGIRYR